MESKFTDNEVRKEAAFKPKDVKMYSKQDGKRFRLPRKAKKQYKKYYEQRLGLNKLKISYKLLNIGIHGNEVKQ